MLFEDLDVWTPYLVELGLRVVDLVDACVELVFLSGETLLTLSFACSIVLLVTCLLAFMVVYARLWMS